MQRPVSSQEPRYGGPYLTRMDEITLSKLPDEEEQVTRGELLEGRKYTSTLVLAVSAAAEAAAGRKITAAAQTSAVAAAARRSSRLV